MMSGTQITILMITEAVLLFMIPSYKWIMDEMEMIGSPSLERKLSGI
jgi:hypothetical protein